MWGTVLRCGTLRRFSPETALRAATPAGIWTRDMKQRTNLPQPKINKILKQLEERLLVKSVKSVQNASRKVGEGHPGGAGQRVMDPSQHAILRLLAVPALRALSIMRSSATISRPAALPARPRSTCCARAAAHLPVCSHSFLLSLPLPPFASLCTRPRSTCCTSWSPPRS